MAGAVLERKPKQASSHKESSAMAESNGHAPKMIYYFGRTKTEGKGEQKELLGGKGANLAEMTSIGLPVPPGFTITTEVCDLYYKSGRKLPAGLMDEVGKNIAMLEKELGKKFGDNRQSAARFGAQRRRPLDAGHDEHDSQPRSQRRVGRRPRQRHEQPALRLRRLSPADQHVWRRGLRCRPRALRRGVRQDQEEVPRQERHRCAARRHDSALQGLQEGLQEAFRQAVPARAAEAARARDRSGVQELDATCGPSRIGRSKTSPACSARPSTCSRWCSATWATTRARASPSRATRPPARTSSTASSSINAQGEDVVAGIRTPLPRRRDAEVEQDGLQATARDQGHRSKTTTATCRTSSSRSRRARSSCCRRATASGPAPPP